MKNLSVDELRTLGMKLGQTFDREKGDLETYALGARAIIELALLSSENAGEEAASYKNVALFTSYNLSAGCWPCWDEASFAVPEELLELGFEFARFNVQLAEELAVGPERRKNGHWILGVHLACRSRFDEALTHFVACEEFAAAAKDQDAELMAQGWVLLMKQLTGDSEAEAKLDSLKTELAARGEDGEFYAGQYDPLLKYLAQST